MSGGADENVIVDEGGDQDVQDAGDDQRTKGRRLDDSTKLIDMSRKYVSPRELENGMSHGKTHVGM